MTQEEQVTAWLQVMQETESITDNERILIARATARALGGIAIQDEVAIYLYGRNRTQWIAYCWK
jgi:hypothetical protein